MRATGGTLQDSAAFDKPPAITPEELTSKLSHLRAVLDRHGASSILLACEGAMRWLTGSRHQVIEIAPTAASPVQALVRLRSSIAEVTFITSHTEMPRIQDQLPGVFEGIDEVRIGFQGSAPPLPDHVLLPGVTLYDTVLGEIVRPLVGGLEGNQLRKLEWLYAITTAVLTDSARSVKAGMNGAEIRGMVFNALASRDVECNLILVALAGQEKHFHPLYDARYRAERGCWIKLVAGSRYADLIVSCTVMGKVGQSLSRLEAEIYAALQRGTVEYADLYRNGMVESDIYTDVGTRFVRIEKETGLKGFQKSAYFHHMGGPTSPLGNRDYLLEAGGSRRMFSWMQFAINPCDVLQYTKVELQGFVKDDGPPAMLDGSRFLTGDPRLFTEIRASGGTTAIVANVIETAD